jgi:DNA mismatch repair protein PMS1
MSLYCSCYFFQENFGLDVIEVKDNGSGVKEADVPFIALPHSTSKISSFHDLCALETYGFRGEALHSLAAMATLSVATCARHGEVAHTYRFNTRGEITSSSPVAMERGTTVMVTNLFKEFPVRRQCYRRNKRCKEELRKIEEYLLAYGIGHPEVRFQLRHNKLTVWQKPIASSFEVNVETILGVRDYQQMAPVNYQCFNPMMKLRAFIPRPGGDVAGLSRATPERTFLLVNRRPVFIKALVQVSQESVDVLFSFHSTGGEAGIFEGLSMLWFPIPCIHCEYQRTPTGT